MDKPRLRGPKPSYDHSEVARLYLAGGRQPTRYVAQAMGVKRDVAAHRVMRSRELGFIPPAPAKGHAGWAEHHPVAALAARGTKQEKRWTVCLSCLSPWPCGSA